MDSLQGCVLLTLVRRAEFAHKKLIVFIKERAQETALNIQKQETGRRKKEALEASRLLNGYVVLGDLKPVCLSVEGGAGSLCSVRTSHL